MYKSGQKVLNKGLSPFSRILLGSTSGLFGVVMILIAPDMSKPIAIYGFGVFCFIIFVMCVTSGKIRNYLGRVIGLIAFCLSIVYFLSQLGEGQLISGHSSKPSIFNAVLFFFAFGFPGIWFAVKGKFRVDHKG
ncbi:hypothetical protein Q4540_00020 [Pseudoalteromonas carrageenovora]|uniref:hypothetical protein n=1 Tax=Pseudoalteromonas carrageenovora TaxID=227 RepID=UPI0026E23AC8|nr:hypothetical protein [Pseudoalteromonas carrageenovora]MDO6636116.1 hypothetical protein [Pseudoalteromonas carrageenovora]MDO6646865.1 hypothetical protein [Pseudoalteromonas carrageenovora]